MSKDDITKEEQILLDTYDADKIGQYLKEHSDRVDVLAPSIANMAVKGWYGVKSFNQDLAELAINNVDGHMFNYLMTFALSTGDQKDREFVLNHFDKVLAFGEKNHSVETPFFDIVDGYHKIDDRDLLEQWNNAIERYVDSKKALASALYDNRDKLTPNQKIEAYDSFLNSVWEYPREYYGHEFVTVLTGDDPVEWPLSTEQYKNVFSELIDMRANRDSFSKQATQLIKHFYSNEDSYLPASDMADVLVADGREKVAIEIAKELISVGRLDVVLEMMNKDEKLREQLGRLEIDDNNTFLEAFVRQVQGENSNLSVAEYVQKASSGQIESEVDPVAPAFDGNNCTQITVNELYSIGLMHDAVFVNSIQQHTATNNANEHRPPKSCGVDRGT